MSDEGAGIDRRTLMKATAAAGLVTAAGERAAAQAPGQGWEWEPMRWIQICATDDDPGRYDKGFWLDLLRRTKTQGVCLSAGGVTAFYPTKVPFHARSAFLGKGDMFGELTRECKAMGIRVLGRVDPHALHADVLAARPDWIARNADGSPKRHPADPSLYLSCPNGPVTFEWMPQILKEIVSTYPVDAIFGNRWAGSAGLCHCRICKADFKRATGRDIPATLGNPRDPVVRAYYQWDDEKRYAQLKLWGDTVTGVRPEAFFTPGTWGRLDPQRLRETVRSVYADRQGRNGQVPGWENGRSAKETYCLMQDRPMSGIFAMSIIDSYRHKDSVQSNAEIRAYLHDGLAHGFRPWMTKFKAEVFDKRWVPVIEKSYSWHAQHESYFRNTDNLARVAMVQSPQTSTYYRAGDSRPAGEIGAGFIPTHDAADGFYQALVEARVPFAMADERQLDPQYVDRFKVLVLPNVAALSDRQCAQLRGYVERGGAIVATHETSLYNEWGEPRANFGLADLFGCDYAGKVDQRVQNAYISVHGPHPLTAGLDDAPRIIGGGKLVHVRPRPGLGKPAFTLVPTYPDLPMEKLFTAVRDTATPMVYARRFGKGRVVYFPTDLDAMYWQVFAEDHQLVLRNAVQWAMDGEQPMTVAGTDAAMLDLSYWRQQGSAAAHLVNLSNPMAMKGLNRGALPVGPFTVSLQLPDGTAARRVRLLEAGTEARSRRDGRRLVVEVPRVDVHEVVAIDFA